MSFTNHLSPYLSLNIIRYIDITTREKSSKNEKTLLAVINI